jgi:hypothetical protein
MPRPSPAPLHVSGGEAARCLRPVAAAPALPRAAAAAGWNDMRSCAQSHGAGGALSAALHCRGVFGAVSAGLAAVCTGPKDGAHLDGATCNLILGLRWADAPEGGGGYAFWRAVTKGCSVPTPGRSRWATRPRARRCARLPLSGRYGRAPRCKLVWK